EMYGKVIVTSKVPLPNYRPDLDDKLPQQEVVLPLSLERRVERLLQEHLDRRQLSSRKRRSMQRAWQRRTMLEFRKSLPSFVDKERLLQAIARNQAIVVSGGPECVKTTQLPQYILESEIESDFVIIVLKSFFPRRPDLRLILMSVTLKAELFSNEFHRDPYLVKRVSAATAVDVRATEIPYTFAPCIAVKILYSGSYKFSPSAKVL
ncbi:hypothetical protein CARUB_v10003557mg, partial [Capsella rubella]